MSWCGFAGTPLDQILRAHGIRTTLICGVATSVCVESTLRDADHHEYFPVMAKDATKAIGEGQREATECNVEKFFCWLTTGAERRAAGECWLRRVREGWTGCLPSATSAGLCRAPWGVHGPR